MTPVALTAAAELGGAALKGIGGLLGRLPQWVWIAVAVAGAAAWIDHRGYERAEKQAKQERLERILDNGIFVLNLDRQLKDGLAELELETADKFATIQQRDRTIVQPIIQSELARDPELATRVCLTPELVRAVNISRGHPGGAGETEDLGASPAGVPGSAGDRGR